MFSLIIRRLMSRSYSMNHLPEDVNSASNIYKLGDRFDYCVRLATKQVQLGNIIAIPTDTIYGLACDAQNQEAIRKLYAVKGREFSKPLAICIPFVDTIDRWGQTDHLPRGLLDELLPGPVTIILNRTKLLNPSLNPDTAKVGIRIPKNDFVQRLTSSLSTPIALTSANKSNEISSVAVEEFEILWSKLDAIFDEGRIGTARSGSTIIDLSEAGKYEIIRRGGYFDETLLVLKKFKFVEK